MQTITNSSAVLVSVWCILFLQYGGVERVYIHPMRLVPRQHKLDSVVLVVLTRLGDKYYATLPYPTTRTSWHLQKSGCMCGPTYIHPCIQSTHVPFCMVRHRSSCSTQHRAREESETKSGTFLDASCWGWCGQSCLIWWRRTIHTQVHICIESVPTNRIA